jgi:arylsulfatase A-like enzyme
MTPPNLLFLYTDEQAAATLAAYGNNAIAMPNLNRLASQGTVFEQAYVTQPVCTPSRASLLTGLYPHTHGCDRNNLPLNYEIPCLPEMIPPRVYETAHFGKWHLGDEVFPQHGFREWRSIDDFYRAYYRPWRPKEVLCDYHAFLTAHGKRPQNGSFFTRGETARFPESLSKPAFLAQETVRFLRDHRNRPFCLFVNFFEPHMPFFGPRDGQYDPRHIPLPPNFGGGEDIGAPLKVRLLREHYCRHGHSGFPLQTPDDWRAMIARYWGLCSLVDTHVGTILEALEAEGLADRTLVVFTSDHGDMMGSHGLIAKCVLYEEAIRVPLLLRGPGVPVGRRIRGPVSHVDLVPTLLDLLGFDRPAHLQGISQRAALEGGTALMPEGGVVVEWNGPNSGIWADESRSPHLSEWMQAVADRETLQRVMTAPSRTWISADGWRFTWNVAGEHELYDRHTDPGERHNRFGDPACKDRVRAMAEAIRNWQRRTADPLVLPPL